MAEARTGWRALFKCGLLALVAAPMAMSAEAIPAGPVAAPRFQCQPGSAAGAQALASKDLAQLALPGLRYQCFTSSSGAVLLTAQAGEQHEQTVLLIHGLGTNGHHDWRENINQLSQRYHVLAIDLPGFGGSPALAQGYEFAPLTTLLQETLAHYAVAQALVIGHSLGGAIALQLAHRYPQNIERLVLVDVAGVLQKQVFVNHIAQLPLPQQLGVPPLDNVLSKVGRHVELLKRNVLAWPEQIFDLSGFLRDNPALRTLILRDQAMIDAAIGLVETDFSAAIRETRVPTTILWGSHDQVTPLRTGRLLAKRMTNARLHLVPGAGHAPMLEMPAEFHRVLIDALALPLTPAPPRPTVAAELLAHAPDRDCLNQNGLRYTGNFRTLRLQNCHGITIEEASIGQLILQNASVELIDVDIHSNTTAVSAERSMLTGTAIDIRGDTAIQANSSRFDLAGARLRGNKQVAEVSAESVFYLSVSHWQRGSQGRDRHDVLQLAPGRY